MINSSIRIGRHSIGAGRAGLIAVLAPALLWLVPAARADFIATENVANFGTFSQLNSGVTGSNALRGQSCVPTSVANGLAFLNNTYGVPGLMQPGYGTVNTLSTDMGTTAANGTTFQQLITGLGTYIGPTGQNVSPPVNIVGGQAATGFGATGPNIQNNTNPTASQFFSWLSAGDAVEIGFTWTNGGGHFVTHYGIDINTIGNTPTGTGTISFLDPFGGTAGNANASAVNIVNASYTTVGGQLSFTYNGGAANNGADPDNSGATPSSGGIIVVAAAEAVPEPASVVLVLSSIVPIGVITLVRRARNRKS
jgi:hypothetical protein